MTASIAGSEAGGGNRQLPLPDSSIASQLVRGQRREVPCAIVVRWVLAPAGAVYLASLINGGVVTTFASIALAFLLVDTMLDMSSGPASALPVLYLTSAALIGLTTVSVTGSGALLKTADLWTLGYTVTAGSAWAGRRLGRNHRPELRGPAPIRHVSRPALAIMVLISSVALLAVVAALPANFFANPQVNREILLSTISPTVQVLYKVTVFTTLALLLYNVAHVSGRSLLRRQVAVVSFAVVVLSLYGGRLLAVLAVVAGLLVYFFYAQRVRWGRLVLAVAGGYIGLSTYAAFRYYARFGDALTTDGVKAQLLAQGSGEFVDGIRISSSNYDLSDADEQLVGDLFGSIPGAIRSLIGASDSTSFFGSYTSAILKQGHVGGIRVGVVGEWLLAWGLVGASALGLVLLGINFFISKYEGQQGRAQLIALGGTLATVATLISGSATAMSYVLALGIVTTLTVVLGASADEPSTDPDLGYARK